MHIERHDDRLLLSDVTPFEWLLGLTVPALLVGTGWTLIPAAGKGEFRLDWGALGFLATVAALLVLRRPRQTEIDRAARTLAITTSPFLPVRRTRIIPFEQVARVSVWQLASRGDLGFCRPLLVLKSGEQVYLSKYRWSRAHAEEVAARVRAAMLASEPA